MNNDVHVSACLGVTVCMPNHTFFRYRVPVMAPRRSTRSVCKVQVRHAWQCFSLLWQTTVTTCCTDAAEPVAGRCEMEQRCRRVVWSICFPGKSVAILWIVRLQERSDRFSWSLAHTLAERSLQGFIERHFSFLPLCFDVEVWKNGYFLRNGSWGTSENFALVNSWESRLGISLKKFNLFRCSAFANELLTHRPISQNNPGRWLVRTPNGMMSQNKMSSDKNVRNCDPWRCPVCSMCTFWSITFGQLVRVS